MGSGLQARVRIESAQGLGHPVAAARVDALPEDLSLYAVVVLDLDEVGRAGIQAVRSRGYEGRLVGFYSHVDESLGAAARDAGVETYGRGRFWREVRALLGANEA